MKDRDPKRIAIIGKFLEENGVEFAEVVDAMILLNQMNPTEIAVFAKDTINYIAIRANQIVKCMKTVQKSDMFKASKLRAEIEGGGVTGEKE